MLFGTHAVDAVLSGAGGDSEADCSDGPVSRGQQRDVGCRAGVCAMVAVMQGPSPVQIQLVSSGMLAFYVDGGKTVHALITRIVRATGGNSVRDMWTDHCL